MHSTKSFISVIETLNNSHYHPNNDSDKSQFALSESFHIPDYCTTYLKSGAFTACNIFKALKYKGIITASASGMQAIVEACQIIRNKEANAALAFGASPEITEPYLKSLYDEELLSDTHEYKLFQGQRLVVGDGSAGILLENLDHALERNARIYAEIEMHSLTEAEESNQLSLQGDLVVCCGSGIEVFDKCEQKWTKDKRIASYKGNYGWIANADGINDTVIASLIIGQEVIPPVLGHDFKIQREKVRKVSVVGFGMDGSAWSLELAKFEGK